MLIISHRGNLDGPDPLLENNPDQIIKCNRIFQVEIDARYENNSWYLGHDSAQYEIPFSFFNDKMWIHCKNIAAVSKFKSMNADLNWFWHQNDSLTLTSKGEIWCYPGVYMRDGITVETEFNTNLPNPIKGICTDFPIKHLQVSNL
jgi:hypothetical protein